MKNTTLLDFVNKTSSSSSENLVTLDAVKNITFTDGVISFDPVTGAEGYNIKFTQDEELIYEDRETLGPRKLRTFLFPWKDDQNLE